MATSLLIGIGTGLIGFSSIVSRGGFITLTMTAITEQKGFGSRFAGTTVGRMDQN